MSIQAGIVYFDGRPIDRGVLLKMSDSLSEFGQDGESLYVQDSLGMLYRPFHTTAESKVERQPLLSPAGEAITWDGRLDNGDELLDHFACKLESYPTDVATVALAFERLGTSCFARLNGDWALSIWRPLQKELILARDYVGVRSLFYLQFPRGVAWCTHLAPLCQCARRLTICEEYIAGYLAFYPDGGLTPYREIKSVPPAHFIVVSNGNISVHSYWSLDPGRKTCHGSDREYEEHFRQLFRQAVRRRLRTESPIIAGLSGGYDSTSIVFMADKIAAEEVGTPRVDTFSYYDLHEPDDDDFVHVLKAEEKRGRTGFHCEMSGSGDSLSFGYVEFAPAPGFGLREEIKPRLASIVKQHSYRVGLSGLGGDELNGQPLDVRILVADLLMHLQPIVAARQLVTWSLLTRIPLLHLLAGSILELLPLLLRVTFSKRAKVNPWVQKEFARQQRMSALLLEDVRGGYLRPAQRDALQTVATLARLITHAPRSVVEQRYPYLDRDLVEFLTSIPLTQLLRPGERRSLMRRALSDLLPAETLGRRTKAAAARCYSLALQKHWTQVSQLFENPLVSEFGFVDAHLIRQSLDTMKNGHVPADFTRLLKALSLEMWLRHVCDCGVLSHPAVHARQSNQLEWNAGPSWTSDQSQYTF